VISRRRLLAGTAGTAGAMLVGGACTGGGGTVDPDVAAATTGAGVERVAIDAYERIRTLLTQGQLGAAIPAAIDTFVVTAADQHHKAMEAWTALLTARGRPAVDEPDRRLKPVVDIAVTRLLDVVGVARLALQLEDYASQAYLQLLPSLRKPDAVTVAARLLVVDRQHQAVLRYIVGLSPLGSGIDDPAQPAGFAPADPRASLVPG
jgi:hypothetical protein